MLRMRSCGLPSTELLQQITSANMYMHTQNKYFFSKRCQFILVWKRFLLNTRCFRRKCKKTQSRHSLTEAEKHTVGTTRLLRLGWTLLKWIHHKRTFTELAVSVTFKLPRIHKTPSFKGSLRRVYRHYKTIRNRIPFKVSQM